REQHVGLARGAGDRLAAASGAVALLPLVGVARRVVAPFAVRLGQRLTLLGGAANARRGFVRRWRRNDHGGRGRGGWAARAAFVARDLAHRDRVADVAREQDVALFCGAGDRRAVVARAVALQPHREGGGGGGGVVARRRGP